MTGGADKSLSWSFVEDFLEEPEAISLGRAHAHELGVECVSPATGAMLRMLAGALAARSTLEIGTGTGVSGLWTLNGMAAGGVLTSIEVEQEYLTAARSTFRQAGVPTTMTRLIAGRALDVLPRMTSGGYDFAVVDGDPEENHAYAAQLERILRPGGIAAFVHALWRDKVADPARREPVVVAQRELARTLRDCEHWQVNLSAVGDGLLVARKL